MQVQASSTPGAGRSATVVRQVVGVGSVLADVLADVLVGVAARGAPRRPGRPLRVTSELAGVRAWPTITVGP
jgi:hypothetical protein